MSTDSLQIEIQEVKGDIQSLHLEIDVLDKEYSALLAQAKDLEESLRQGDEPYNLQEIHGHSKANYDIDGPPVIKNSCFDESIRKYFTNVLDDVEEEESTEVVTKRQKLDIIASDFKAKSETILEMKQNILYENIFRFGGVTSFPLNPFLFDENDEIMGLRFDVFSHYKRKFITPHYVILRKMKNTEKGLQTTMKWEVYRHTLPVYLPISEYSECLHEDEEVAFSKFTQQIREHLIQIQYKHDKFDFLRNIKYDHISKNRSSQGRVVIEKLEKDLQCQRINITLLNRVSNSKRASEINLVCTNNEIKEVGCIIAGVDSDDKIIIQCESLLKNCDLKDLIKTFKNVIGHLIKGDKL